MEISISHVVIYYFLSNDLIISFLKLVIVIMTTRLLFLYPRREA